MCVWKLSLRRMKSAIISWDGSFEPHHQKPALEMCNQAYHLKRDPLEMLLSKLQTRIRVFSQNSRLWFESVQWWEIMTDVTSLTPPSPGLSETLFQKRSVVLNPTVPKGPENVKIPTKNNKNQTGLLNYRNKFLSLEILDKASACIILSRQWTTKPLVRLGVQADLHLSYLQMAYWFSHNLARMNVLYFDKYIVPHAVNHGSVFFGELSAPLRWCGQCLAVCR